MLNLVKKLMVVLVVLGFSTPSYAATPSPAMIAQLKKLPRAEQQKIAKQYGFDLAALSEKPTKAMPLANQDTDTDPTDPLKPMERFDEKQKTDEEEKDPTIPERYGLKLFDSTISTFAPVGNVPVPDTYVLGPDDELMVQVYGKQSAEETVTVNRDGTLHIPGFSPVQVAGLSFSKAKALISSRISQENIGVEVAVSMGKLRTISIFVSGEAKYPGSYTVSALSTVTQALFVAGGVSDIGSLREISIKRSGIEVARFDLYSLLLHGDSTQDVHLRNGDVIFVAPVKAMAEVAGEVQRPALYEVKAGDSVKQLVEMAGGSKAGAFPRSVVLERFNELNVRTLLNLDLTDISDQKVQVRNGDVLRIGLTSKRVENIVTMAGAVVRPGQYAWFPGIKVSDLLNSLWSDLHLTVDLDYALVVRETSELGELKVLQFNLGKAITEPSSADNLNLSARDLILVFHHGEESYARPELDNYLYTKLKKQYSERQLFAKTEPELDEKAPQPFALDIANLTTQAFSILSEKVVIPVRKPGIAAEVPKVRQKADHEAYLKFLISDLFKQLYFDAQALKLSSHLTRTELLYPLIQKLKQQAKFNAATQILSVQGEVKVPGEYPLVENATVAELLVAAGGLNDSAYLERAEITRSVSQSDIQSGLRIQHIAVNLADILQGTKQQSVLSRDRLTVFAVPDWNIERSITITGQVKFPGTYAIQ
ncbi:MAG: SLBB domain-containing protein, partial [Gammaproteobacteria bacterium]|nr:SLBB domain-containing protein [Gammaproteobacteria bacterium]